MSDLISIIVPTYNESGNVSTLVHRIDNALSDRRYEIVFVDDDSPDSTAAKVTLLSDKYPVKAIVRKDKRGLASAVVEGFSHISGDIVAVMDADLQHPPNAIPGLISEIENGADLAIASRYVPGGKVTGLNPVRKLVSRGATFIAHLLLPATRDIKDPMSGFFAFDRGVVENIDLKPIGFKILLEILTMGKYRNVAQVPITFAARDQGQSKLSVGQQLDYLKHIFSLMKRKGELFRFLKFCVVGASGVGVNLGLLWLLTEKAGLFYLVSAVISIEVSIISNFLLNNFFTFTDRRRQGIQAFFKHLLRFNTVSLAGVGINLGTLWLLTSAMGIYYLISNCVGIALATLWNYLVNNWWTWDRK
jgi:dolichol-phosphate mannosyltransferase